MTEPAKPAEISVAKRAMVLSKMLDSARATLQLREKNHGWSEENRQMWRDRVQVLDEVLAETVEGKSLTKRALKELLT